MSSLSINYQAACGTVLMLVAAGGMAIVCKETVEKIYEYSKCRFFADKVLRVEGPTRASIHAVKFTHIGGLDRLAMACLASGLSASIIFSANPMFSFPELSTMITAVSVFLITAFILGERNRDVGILCKKTDLQNLASLDKMENKGFIYSKFPFFNSQPEEYPAPR